MITLTLAVIAAALVVAHSNYAAASRVTRELRAIAEQEAEERRNRGLDANIAARWRG